MKLHPFFLIYSVYCVFQAIRSQGISSCNSLTTPISLSLSEKCSNFSLFYSNNSMSDPYLFCLSTTKDSFLTMDVNLVTISLLKPEKERLFSSTDSCIGMKGSYFDNIVCVNNADLLRWNIFTGAVKVFKGTNQANITKIDIISENFSTLVIIKDNLSNVKIVDMVYLTENLSIVAENFIKITDDLIGFQINNAGSRTIQVFSLLTIAKKYEIVLDLDIAVYIENAGFRGILGNKKNQILFWDFVNTNSYNEIAKFDVDILDITVINLTNIIMIGNDTSIFHYDLINNKKTFIETVSYFPQIFQKNQELILIKSYNIYFYNVSSQRLIKSISTTNVIDYFRYNTKAYTIGSILTFNTWDFAVCDTTNLIQYPADNISYAFNFEQETTRVGLLNKGNQLMILQLLTNELTQFSLEALSNLYCNSVIHIPSDEDNLIISCYRKEEIHTSNIYHVNLNSRRVVKIPIGDFSCSINFLIYMNLEDYIAFECDGYIHVYSVFHYNLIYKWEHQQTTLINGLIPLKSSPNNLGSSSSVDVKIWDIYSGQLVKWIKNSGNSFFGCIHLDYSLLNSNSGLACFLTNTQSNASLIKIWDLGNLTVLMEAKYPSSSINFQSIRMKSIQLEHNYLFVSNNKEIDKWDLTTNTLIKSLSINIFSNNLLLLLSSETILFDVSPTSLMLWDFSQTQSKNLSCLSNYYYNSINETCDKCNSSCGTNQFCVSSNPDICYFPKCFFFLSENKKYTNCFENNQESNVFIDSNAFCIKCTNVSNICYSQFCFACENGFYYSDTSCIGCDSSCETCFGDGASKCMSCSDSDYDLDDNFTCVYTNKAKLIIIIIFSIILGILVILIWIYIFRLYKRTLTNNNNPSRSAILKTPGLDDLECFLFSESPRMQDYWLFVIKIMSHLKENIKNNINKNEMKRIANYLALLQKKIPENYYNIKESKEVCYKINDVFQVDLISVGSFGPVYFIENKTQQKFIWKVIFNNSEENIQEKIDSLIDIAKENLNLKEKNISNGCSIVGVGCSYENNSLICGIVQEYYEYNLSSFRSKFHDNLEIQFTVIKLLLQKMNEYSNIKFVHGNLKSFNVLINFTENNYKKFKIGLGLSDTRKYKSIAQLTKSIRSLDKQKLRLAYIPPEMFFGDENFEFNQKSEIWGLGIIIFEMFYDDKELYQMRTSWIETLWKGAQEKEENKSGELLENVKQIIKNQNYSKEKNEFCSRKTQVNPEITEIINGCLQINPDNRLNIKELIERVERVEMLIPTK